MKQNKILLTDDAVRTQLFKNVIDNYITGDKTGKGADVTFSDIIADQKKARKKMPKEGEYQSIVDEPEEDKKDEGDSEEQNPLDEPIDTEVDEPEGEPSEENRVTPFAKKLEYVVLYLKERGYNQIKILIKHGFGFVTFDSELEENITDDIKVIAQEKCMSVSMRELQVNTYKTVTLKFKNNLTLKDFRQVFEKVKLPDQMANQGNTESGGGMGGGGVGGFGASPSAPGMPPEEEGLEGIGPAGVEPGTEESEAPGEAGGGGGEAEAAPKPE